MMKNDFKLSELRITQNELGRYKLRAIGLHKGEKCEIDIPDIEHPEMDIESRREGVGQYQAYYCNCNVSLRAKVNAVDDKYYSITVPRVNKLKEQIDYLNEELVKLQNELKNIEMFTS